MHDINGKALILGDNIYSPAYGFLIIKDVKAEHSNENGGALIEVFKVAGGKGDEIRTHDAQVVKVRTWKELANFALNVQDASNLSGVVHSFSDIISEVRHRLESEGKGGTDNVNNHPICRLFSDKIASLTSTQTFGHEATHEAYTWAYAIKEGKNNG